MVFAAHVSDSGLGVGLVWTAGGAGGVCGAVEDSQPGNPISSASATMIDDVAMRADSSEVADDTVVVEIAQACGVAATVRNASSFTMA
jgi:hypothetical protein